MQSISTALRNAIDAGNKQRVLLVFNNDEFSNEDIVMSSGIELSEEFNSETDLTIGIIPSSIISFTMLNDNGQLNDFNFGWFTAYIGAMITSGTPTEITRTFVENGISRTYAFAPIGTFYADKPDIIAKKTISVTAYDQMTKFDVDMVDSTTLGITYPTTLSDIFVAICTYVGVSYSSATFFNSDLEVEKEPEDFRMATIRQVLCWMAECACSNLRFNRDSQLEFVWFNTISKTYNENNYKEFTPVWYQTQAINGLYVRNTTLSTEESFGTVKTNNYLIQDNPFLP